MPGLETVLAAESMAAASWVGVEAPEDHGWRQALARAFALKLLHPKDARAWRQSFQECAAPPPGTTPSFSPHASGATGFAEVAATCGARSSLGIPPRGHGWPAGWPRDR